jgi:hypothetical protein
VKKAKKSLGDHAEEPDEAHAMGTAAAAEAAAADAALEVALAQVSDDEENALAQAAPVASPAAAAAEATAIKAAATKAAATATAATAAAAAVAEALAPAAAAAAAAAAEVAATPRANQTALSAADRSRDLSDLSLKWMAHYHFDQGNQVRALLFLAALFFFIFCSTPRCVVATPRARHHGCLACF